MTKILLSFLMLIPAAALAEGTSIKSGTAVQFVDWKADCRCYEVVVESNVALGPFYTTLDEIIKAIPEFPSAKTYRSPTSILMTRYLLDQPLPLLTDKQLEIRNAAAKTSK